MTRIPRSQELAELCASMAEDCEHCLVGLYDAMADWEIRNPELEAVMLQAHQALVRMRKHARGLAVGQAPVGGVRRHR